MKSGDDKMILVTGAKGFVGHKIMELGDTIACPSLRGASEDEVKRIVEESGADVIIHTAAISDVRACEEDPESSYIANVQLPLYLAKAAKNRKLICFSSDQVYTGTREDGPYTEDMAKPANTYAKHKLEMEQRVLEIQPDAVMLRAEWMYDYYQERLNYFTIMINAADTLSFSSKEYRGITYLKEVVGNMSNVIALPGGVYNFGSETTKSMYDITREFLKVIGKDIRLEDAPAGHNLWMNCEKARRFGVEFSNVTEGLVKCAEDYHFAV